MRQRLAILARLVVVVAMAGCDEETLVPNDDGKGAAVTPRFDAGLPLPDEEPADAGGQTDGGLDAGPLEPQPEICLGELPAEGWPCEPDADFCDPLGDNAPAPADLIAGWSRQEGAVAVFELRFAAPLFTGLQHELAINVRTDDPVRDMWLPCGDAPENRSNFLLALQQVYVQGYVPCAYSIADCSQGACNTWLDACTWLSVSEDGRTLQLRAEIDGVLESWWVGSRPSVESDEADGFNHSTYIASRGGAQGETDFVPSAKQVAWSTRVREGEAVPTFACIGLRKRVHLRRSRQMLSLRTRLPGVAKRVRGDINDERTERTDRDLLVDGGAASSVCFAASG